MTFQAESFQKKRMLKWLISRLKQKRMMCWAEPLVMLFVLIDSRHDIGKIDMDFLFELGQSQIPFAIIFTKGDKMGPVALEKQVDKIKSQILERWEELPPTFVSSSETGLGREEILDYIESVLNSLKENK